MSERIYLGGSESVAVVTSIVAPRYSQENMYILMTPEKAREYADGVAMSLNEGALLGIFSLPNIYTGIFGVVAGYLVGKYKESIANEIKDAAKNYDYVFVKVCESQYGKFYSVKGTNSSVAVELLDNEYVQKIIRS